MNSNNEQDGREYQRLDIHPKVLKKLSEMQRGLKVPKLRKMRIGSSEVLYRNAEDVLSAATKIMGEGWTIVTSYNDYHDETTSALMLSCTARLVSEEGYYAGVTFSAPVEGLGAQKKGAARSYALRYALCDLFGISDGIDTDDLTAATSKLQTPPAPKAQQVPLEQAIADIEAATDNNDLKIRARKYSYYYSNEKFCAAGRAKSDSFNQPANPITTDGKDNAQ